MPFDVEDDTIANKPLTSPAAALSTSYLSDFHEGAGICEANVIPGSFDSNLPSSEWFSTSNLRLFGFPYPSTPVTGTVAGRFGLEQVTPATSAFNRGLFGWWLPGFVVRFRFHPAVYAS